MQSSRSAPPSVGSRLFTSDEESLFRETVRAFLDKELDGRIEDFRENRRDVRDYWKAAARAGLVGLSIPEEYGGAGAGSVTNVIVSFEHGRSLGYGYLGSTITSDAIGYMVFRAASEELKREIAPRVLAGEIQTLAMTEPGAGTNSTAMATHARRDGADFVLNGSKAYISHGDIADIIHVVAKTDPGRGWDGGISVFALDAAMPGVRQGRIRTLAHPGTGLGEISFDDVRVPAYRVIGEVGGALELVSPTVVLDRVQIAARALAQAELAVELSTRYAKERIVQGGQSLFGFQHTQVRLAEMSIDVETGFAVLAHTLDKLRAGTCRQRDAAIAKVSITEMSARVLDGAVQLFGAAGVADEYPIAGMYAANRVFRIIAGTSELLKLSVARKL